MAARKAHKLEDRERTRDIEIEEDVDFGSMFLSDEVLGGLQAAGFQRPSPIQLAAIPLGRCGLDLVVQAKSGTGKTCVFTVVALEMVSVAAPTTQVLVLAPTREVAVQIAQVLVAMSSTMPSLKVATFIGGIHLAHDRAKLQCCHVAVGTPGRVAQLVEMGLLKLDNVRLFVLDEADQLLSGQFTKEVVKLAAALPLNKQVLATSATYTEEVAKVAESLMRSPSHVRLGRECPSLLGVGQFVLQLSYHHHSHRTHKAKFSYLLSILSSVTFNQCLVFSNSQLRAESIRNQLRGCGWPVSLLMGRQKQRDRLAALESLCSYQCRVLVSTDLAARGLDSEHVNLVVNMDVPSHQSTYLHRVGRAGRFGSKGAAITLATEGDEWYSMRAIITLANVQVQILQENWPATLTQHQLKNAEKLEFLSEDELARWVSLNSSSQNNSQSYEQSQELKDKRNSVLQREGTENGKGTKLVNGTHDMSDDSEDSGKENREANCISAKTVSKFKHRTGEAAATDKHRTNKAAATEKKSYKKRSVTDAGGNKVQETEHKEEKSEEFEKCIKMQKEEDHRKVIKLFQGLNVSPTSVNVSYAEVFAEFSEKYDNISATDDPVVQIPPLPDKLELSEDDFKALERYSQTIQEEVKQRTDEADGVWIGSSVDIHTALQALIEGKNPQNLIVRDGGGGEASCTDQDRASKDSYMFPSPFTAVHKTPERKSTQDKRETLCQSLETSPSTRNSATISKQREKNGVRRKSPNKLPEKSINERLYSEQSSQDQSDYDQKTRKTKLSSRKQVNSKRGSKKKDERRQLASESQPVKTHNYYYGEYGQYYDNQWPEWRESYNTYCPGWEQYKHSAHQYPSHHNTEGYTNNHYQNSHYQYPKSHQDKGFHSSQTESDSNYYYNTSYPQYFQNYDYQGNYESGQPYGYYSQYGNGFGSSYNDWYRQQQSYIESACKFASMMDYVQTMGRMSAKMAHDYFMRKGEEDGQEQV